jgi:hypothetical protein
MNRNWPLRIAYLSLGFILGLVVRQALITGSVDAISGLLVAGSLLNVFVLERQAAKQSSRESSPSGQ